MSEKLYTQAEVDEIEAVIREKADHYKRACIESDHFITETLAPALGYECDPDYGLVIGDHTAESLAAEAGSKIADLERRVSAARAEGWDEGFLAARTRPSVEGVVRRTPLTGDEPVNPYRTEESL